MKISVLTTAFMALAALPAAAATISVSSFSATAYNAAVGSGPTTTENFETFGEGNVADGFATSVGTFATVGGVGSGGTVTRADFDNDGSMLAIRDGNVFGRKSTTSALSGNSQDNTFLDSNDGFGIAYTASLGGRFFNKIVLTLTDAADTGAILEILTGDAAVSFARKGNGNKQLVVIDLGEKVETASIFFNHRNKNGSLRRNDGFSIDDISVSEVPLPASAFLLLAGIGGLGAYGRRKKTV